jgi:hypothetical protein
MPEPALQRWNNRPQCSYHVTRLHAGRFMLGHPSTILLRALTLVVALITGVALYAAEAPAEAQAPASRFVDSEDGWFDISGFLDTAYGFVPLTARKHGLHMGIDVAVGPDDPIVHVVFGNAWLRP